MSTMVLDIDVNTVRHSMLQYEQEVESIDRKIESHNRAIQQLLLRKEQRLADIQVCKERLTLANRLPPEILVHIFELYILDDVLDVGSFKRGPLTLSHVCSSWKQAANSPTLWSYIHGDLLITRSPEALIHTWLSRSHDTPLTIDIVLLSHVRGSVLHPAMDAILEEMSRWKHLKLKGRSARNINAFLTACTEPAPQLRTIDITVEQTVGQGEQVAGIQKVFTGSPHIQTIRIAGHIVPNSGPLPASLTQLTLVLPYLISSDHQYYQSILHLVILLDTLPNLQTLMVEVPLSHHTDFLLDAENARPVDLVNLTSLTLSGPGDIFGLLPRIKVPSLKRLILSGSMEATVNQKTGQWLLHLLQESSPPLSHLALVDLTIDDTTYIQLFTSLPFLEILGVHDSDISDTVFQSLYGPSCLCPLLKRLDLRWCQKLSGDVIIDVVRSRSSKFSNGTDLSTQLTPISEVMIIHCGLVGKDHISILEELTTCRTRRQKYDDMCNRWRCCGTG